MAADPNEFSRYSIFAGRFGDLLVRNLSEQRIQSGSNKTEIIPGGLLDRTSVVNAFSDPMISCSTIDLDGLFAGTPAVSLTAGYAVNINAGSPTAATLIQMQKRADGAAFQASGSAVHFAAQNNKGFLHVAEINAAQDSIEGVVAQLEYYALSTDGQLPAITGVTTSALTSTPIEGGGIWYLGPVYVGPVGGTQFQIRGVQSVRIKPGIQYAHKRGDGNIYPIVGSIISRKPEIKITMLDASDWYGVLSAPLFAGDYGAGTVGVNCYMQKGVHGGSRYGKGTNNHYRFSSVSGDKTTDEISVRGTEDGMFEVTFRPTGVMSVTAATTIP